MEGEFDAGGVGFKVGAHVVGFVVAGAGHFFLVQVALDVDQAGEPVDDGPEIGDEAEEGVYRGQGGAVMDRMEFLRAWDEDCPGHWRGAKGKSRSNVEIAECPFKKGTGRATLRPSFSHNRQSPS